MRRLTLSALALAAVLYVPVPLGAHPSGGTKALVPVEEIQETVSVPAGTGAAEAPAAAAPAPPPPPPEEPPQLVPPAEVESQPAPDPGAAAAPVPVPAPEPVAAPALRPNAELAQDEPTDTTPEQTPNQEGPGEDPQDDDPEEFEEDFDDDTVPERGDDGESPGVAPTPGRAAVPVSERLPETGRELLLLSLIGTGLLLVGGTLRRLSRPRLRHL